MIAQIIVADDNPDIAGLVTEYLALKGHRVITVHDGFTLSQKAAEHRPHLIISDIQMPGAYGSSAYQVLQKDDKTNKIPVLFMSAHPLAKIASILPKDPKTRFIQKPLDLDKMDALIAELLPMGGYCP